MKGDDVGCRVSTRPLPCSLRKGASERAGGRRAIEGKKLAGPPPETAPSAKPSPPPALSGLQQRASGRRRPASQRSGSFSHHPATPFPPERIFALFSLPSDACPCTSRSSDLRTHPPPCGKSAACSASRCVNPLEPSARASSVRAPRPCPSPNGRRGSRQKKRTQRLTLGSCPSSFVAQRPADGRLVGPLSLSCLSW